MKQEQNRDINNKVQQNDILKPTFAPKIPARRRTIDKNDNNLPKNEIDLASGPKQLIVNNTQENRKNRPNREKLNTSQIPHIVTFQPSIPNSENRNIKEYSSTIPTYSTDLYNNINVIDEEDLMNTLQKSPNKEIISTYLPYPIQKKYQAWYDTWKGPDPIQLPAYKDPSLPSTNQNNNSIQDTIKQEYHDDKESINDDIQKYIQAPPYPSLAEWFIGTDKNNDEEELYGENNLIIDKANNSNDKGTFCILQLPTHLPVHPPSIQSDCNKNNSTTNNKTQQKTHIESNTISLDEALLYDEPLIVDDGLVHSGLPTKSLTEQYRTFHENGKNSLFHLPSNKQGDIIVYRSGKVKLRIGELYFDQNCGNQVLFRQELFYINSNDKNESILQNLGPILKHIIASFDVDTMMKQKDVQPYTCAKSIP